MGNNFTNNYNSKLPPGNGAVIALEMKTSNINAEFLEMDNMFVNDNLGIDARVFVQPTGVPIVVPTAEIKDPDAGPIIDNNYDYQTYQKSITFRRKGDFKQRDATASTSRSKSSQRRHQLPISTSLLDIPPP
ncbi:hypothetical protein M9Y10_026848 [Tritrichomonas musculus]|uniref:Uncharacterized protein n=1 Tax=Tritrichomonas musculus TaxID=1915356 RepID=A0ABR2H7R9_9EUKA